MTTNSPDVQSPAGSVLLRRFLKFLLTPGPAEDPRRRKRFGGYRLTLDDKSIALYGYDKRQLSEISATLNLY